MKLSITSSGSSSNSIVDIKLGETVVYWCDIDKDYVVSIYTGVICEIHKNNRIKVGYSFNEKIKYQVLNSEDLFTSISLVIKSAQTLLNKHVSDKRFILENSEIEKLNNESTHKPVESK